MKLMGFTCFKSELGWLGRQALFTGTVFGAFTGGLWTLDVWDVVWRVEGGGWVTLYVVVLVDNNEWLFGCARSREGVTVELD